MSVELIEEAHDANKEGNKIQVPAPDSVMIGLGHNDRSFQTETVALNRLSPGLGTADVFRAVLPKLSRAHVSAVPHWPDRSETVREMDLGTLAAAHVTTATPCLPWHPIFGVSEYTVARRVSRNCRDLQRRLRVRSKATARTVLT